MSLDPYVYSDGVRQQRKCKAKSKQPHNCAKQTGLSTFKREDKVLSMFFVVVEIKGKVSNQTLCYFVTNLSVS